MDAIQTSAAVTLATEGLKFIRDSVNRLRESKTDFEVQRQVGQIREKLDETQDALFKLRENLLVLQQENSELSGKIASFEKWEGQVSRYLLVKAEGGAIVYLSKDLPKHFACPSCINQKRIEILQFDNLAFKTSSCPSCNASYQIDKRPIYKDNSGR